MRLHLWRWVLAGVLAGLVGCKDPETRARLAQERTAAQKLEEGRAHLAGGRLGEAIAALRAAASVAPGDPSPHLLMAEAHRLAGNDGAAILAIKHAAELSADADPKLRKELAALYRRAGHRREAIGVMVRLRDKGELADDEVLALARMQAHEGDIDAAFGTLEFVQRRSPDDPQAKVLEAEILLLKGEESLAATLMDRLVQVPDLPEAWVLRARYFLNNGVADAAEDDLRQIPEPHSERPDVVRLRARVLNELGRHDEAEAALRGLLQKSPRDEELIAQLAESLLYQGRPQEAAQMIDEALARRPRDPRALYVRGRALEAQGELGRAAETYGYALRSDPSFAPALSRAWRLQLQRGEKAEAASALEQLFFLGEASLEEKVVLAELYADLKMNVERGRRIIGEALSRDPQNARYKQIRQALFKAGARGPPAPRGPQILRGGR
jgi:tetratricopeptide (TPR) repeat protein